MLIGFPYELSVKTERHYRVVFYLVFKLISRLMQQNVTWESGS